MAQNNVAKLFNAKVEMEDDILRSAAGSMTEALKAGVKADKASCQLVIVASYSAVFSVGKLQLAGQAPSDAKGIPLKAKAVQSDVWTQVTREMIRKGACPYEATEDLWNTHVRGRKDLDLSRGITQYLKSVNSRVKLLRATHEAEEDKSRDAQGQSTIPAFRNPHQMQATIRKARTLFANVVMDVLAKHPEKARELARMESGSMNAWMEFFVATYGGKLSAIIATFAAPKKTSDVVESIVASLAKLKDIESIDAVLAELNQMRGEMAHKATETSRSIEALSLIGDEDEDEVPFTEGERLRA